MLYAVQELQRWDVQQELFKGYWVPARPVWSTLGRWKHAWWVLIGKCDAVWWPIDGNPYRRSSNVGAGK